jgi:hypothetical protein
MGYITIQRTGDRLQLDYASPYNNSYNESIFAVGIKLLPNSSPKSIQIYLTNLKQTLEIQLDQVASPVCSTIEELLTAIQALIKVDSGNVPESFTVTDATQALFTTVMALTSNYKVEIDGSLVPRARTSYTSIHSLTLNPPAEQSNVVTIYAQ